MTERSNFDEQIRSLLEGHEPAVQPDWARMNAALDAQAAQERSTRRRQRLKVRRTRARWMAGAGLVAMLGLGWWVRDVVIEFTQKEVLIEESAMGGNQGTDGRSGVAGESFNEVAATQKAAQGNPAETNVAAEKPHHDGEGAARTSNEWRISPALAGAQQGGGMAGRAVAAAGDAKGSAMGAESAGTSVSASEAPLAFRSSVQEACQGTEVSFSMDGNIAKGSFLWNFGDGTFSNEPAPTHVFQRPGTYDITISIRSHNDGMIRTRTVENMIVVRPIPDAQLAWKLPEIANSGKIPVELINQTDRASSAVWILDEQRVDRSAMELEVPGVYDVHLIASNAYGCQDDARGIIKLGDRVGASAPAVFSPNGDGRYDSFFPGIASSMSANWQLVIVDEQGKKVFESNSALKPWDGTLANGGRVSPGQTYRWTLTGKDRKGQNLWYSDVVKIER